MRNLLSIVFCLIFSYSAIGQQTNTSLTSENEYMEVRYLPFKGVSYRLAPDLPFQSAGFLNRNMTPYFKQYDESLRYHKQHRRSLAGMIGGTAIYSVGFGAAFLGVVESNANTVRLGSASAIVGFSLMLWSNHTHVSSVHKAVDAYNQNKNPNLQGVEYIEFFPHPYTMWQFRTSPTEDYKFIGLYGSKLKTHFQQDDAAFNAYKKYRAGHIAYSLGNVSMITGTAMMFTGMFTNNSAVSRNGLITTAGGLAAVFIGSSAMGKNLYQAADLLNYKESSLLNSSLMPSIQLSSYSAGLGLVWNIE